MRITFKLLILTAPWAVLLGAAEARAQGDALSDNRYGESSGITTAGAETVTRGYLQDENFSVMPELGVLAFRDILGNNTSRLAAGLAMDWNLSGLFMGDHAKDYFIGPSTGFIFSHMGSATSNFIGTSPDTAVNDAGSNLLVIPADVKIGYALSENFRLSLHGGGNVTYRSVASTVNFGDSALNTGSSWNFYPNVGGDVEIGFGRNVAFLMRPDFTLTPGEAFFTGMLGLGIRLG